MRYGFRRPNFNKSFSARTRGRYTRMAKRSINPYYGRRGMGMFHPRRSMYNRMYYRTTRPTYSGCGSAGWIIFFIIVGCAILGNL